MEMPAIANHASNETQSSLLAVRNESTVSNLLDSIDVGEILRLMNVVRIVYDGMPSSGMYIPQQECEYCKAPNCFPSIKVLWKGKLFGSRDGVFIFAEDCITAAPLSDKFARLQTKICDFSGGASKSDRMFAGGLIAGVVANLITGTVGLMSGKTSDIKGFAILYLNEKQKQGSFQAVAQPRIVDEILASIPAHKLRPMDDRETRF